MADLTVAALEAKLQKFCAQWALDVTKILAHQQEAIKSRTRLLRQKIVSLQVPKEAGERELSQIPARINEILHKESAELRGLVSLDLRLTIDVKAKKLNDVGHRLSGGIMA